MCVRQSAVFYSVIFVLSLLAVVLVAVAATVLCSLARARTFVSRFSDVFIGLIVILWFYPVKKAQWTNFIQSCPHLIRMHDFQKKIDDDNRSSLWKSASLEIQHKINEIGRKLYLSFWVFSLHCSVFFSHNAHSRTRNRQGKQLFYSPIKHSILNRLEFPVQREGEKWKR